MSTRKMQVGDWYDVDVPMRWADSDMMAHLNNVVYFRYMEQARVELIDRSGIRDLDTNGFVVAHTACDYLKPIHYPATVRVRTIMARVGRTSFEQHIEMRLADDPTETLYATGKVVMVLVDKASGRPVPLPENLLIQLGEIMQPGVQDA